MPRHPFTLDASSPSIIVPLTAPDLPELGDQVAALSSRPAQAALDAVEWRVDLFAPFTAGGGIDPATQRGLFPFKELKRKIKWKGTNREWM